VGVATAHGGASAALAALALLAQQRTGAGTGRHEKKYPVMRKSILLVLGLLALAGVARSADEEMDEDLMQSIEDTNKSLSSNIAQHDDHGSADDARELGDMFSRVEVYFVQRGHADDAVDLARKSRQLTLDIMHSVATADFDAAADASVNLSRTCKTCHRTYKKDKDKTQGKHKDAD